MRPELKRVKEWAEFCPNCKEQLSGNNSYTFPWSCRCGIWELTNEYPPSFEYQIKKV